MTKLPLAVFSLTLCNLFFHPLSNVLQSQVDKIFFCNILPILVFVSTACEKHLQESEIGLLNLSQANTFQAGTYSI